jgi:hypothetical protein
MTYFCTSSTDRLDFLFGFPGRRTQRYATKALLIENRRPLRALSMCPAEPPSPRVALFARLYALDQSEDQTGQVQDRKGEEGFSAVALSALFAL